MTFQIEIEIDGRALSGSVEVYPGSWGGYLDPPDPPQVEGAALVDSAGRPVDLDIEDDQIEAAIMEAVIDIASEDRW